MRYFIIVDGTVEDAVDSKEEAQMIVKAKLSHEDPQDVEVAGRVPVMVTKSEIHFLAPWE